MARIIKDKPFQFKWMHPTKGSTYINRFDNYVDAVKRFEYLNSQGIRPIWIKMMFSEVSSEATH